MLKVGIIGTGNIVNSHIAGYLEFPGECEIVAFCDLVPAKAAAKRDEHGLAGARVYADPAEMLADEDLDLVSIATPPSTHAQLAIQLLRGGVNVIVEKPMAPSLEECDAMLAAERESGKVLSVVAQNRFRDDMAALKDVLDSGLVGPISHVQVNSSWWRGLPYYDLSWRGTWASEGGGCTLNHAIHHIDLLLWMMGRPDSVTAVLTNAQHENAEVEDLSVAILQYGRALAEVTSSVVHHGQEAGIVVHGRDARVSQPWRAVAEVTQPNGFPVPGGDAALVAQLDDLFAAHSPLAHTGHGGQIGEILAALRAGRRPAIDGVDGRNAVELVTAIYKSGIERATVDFPLQPDDPYYRTGTLEQRAPHFFEKTVSIAELDGTITVGVAE
ncbi:Gfo/Idh/MocA family protein [Microbacterium ulmi]|uniref:Gfo/Idh/MocA family oxidoreductase n=1 Tax=Microbacterium ulmi TaxID=179095 RepID=A0A7Y2M201_9MICO|nr:Gfo/Idh/MocA family oxidoreductase [Microbacterium ulmi]NII68586.1 putative dehydrogenase [Microbacterium ulmi]NNH05041.1 Gfo/Idh/MocA family oxidoreductase [Microbacterium ulmi]